MVRGIAELDEILEEIQAKVFLANRMDELDELLEKWGFTQFIEKKMEESVSITKHQKTK